MESKNKMNSLKSKLPEELISKIQNINCKKNINGDKKSNELILIFDLNKTAEDVHDELLQWLFRCLDTISHKVERYELYEWQNKVERYGQYEWQIISGIKDNDYDDSDNLSNDASESCKSKIVNSIIVAIHITNDEDGISDNFTIPFCDTPDIVLSPQEIVDCLINEPNFVKNIGVSAVSSETMMYWWRDIISKEPNHLDVAGKGYMVHPMWRKGGPADSLWGDWNDVREMSFNFGWKGYSPEK
tara:strand:- start:364 stop:1095 length:732 start_codon:yes stop_codon:yes gene_type:complete